MPAIESGGRRIVYDDYGAGPPLVMLHGSYASSAAWRGIGKLLEDRYRIVAPNLIGYGGPTGWPDGDLPGGEPDLVPEAEVVEAVAARLEEPPVLVGHSYGGTVALAAALRGKVDLAGLVLIEPTSLGVLAAAGEQAHFDDVMEVLRRFEELLATSEEEGARYMIDYYGVPGAFDALPAAVRDYCTGAARANAHNWTATHRFVPDLDRLADIEAPALVVRAGDGLEWVNCVCQTVAGRLANSRLVEVAGANHFIVSTHGSQVAALIHGHAAGGDTS